MTKNEYEEIQNRLSNKLKHQNHPSCCTNKESAYNDGILACKSIIKEIYNRGLTVENH